MLDIKPLTGDESITIGRHIPLSTIFDFWRWTYSDLNMPTVRGDLAEYLVFLALRKRGDTDIGVPVDHDQTRMGWDMVDLTYGHGIYEARGQEYFCPSTAHGWGVKSNPRLPETSPAHALASR